jgi:hypothetical protein
LKALVETVRSFRQIRPLKIVVALRTDLYFTMTQRTNSPGFQEEKFSGYYIHLKWTRQQLCDLLDRRVSRLYQRQYTQNDVGLSDLLPPNQIEKGSASDYILDRTFFRPREAIAFMNKCIEKAEGKSRLTVQIIRDAESTYSAERLNSVYDEWRREYPYLRDLVALVRGGRPETKIRDLSVEEIESFSLRFYSSQKFASDPALAELAENAAMDAVPWGLPLLRRIIAILYQTGILGVKLLPNSARMWSFEDRAIIDPQEISEETVIFVHKAFHRALSVTYDRT